MLSGLLYRWKPFDPSRNWPDLGPKFIKGERMIRLAHLSEQRGENIDESMINWEETVANDKRDLDWATVLKRTFESYVRGERPNMYGEWLQW